MKKKKNTFRGYWWFSRTKYCICINSIQRWLRSRAAGAVCIVLKSACRNTQPSFNFQSPFQKQKHLLPWISLQTRVQWWRGKNVLHYSINCMALCSSTHLKRKNKDSIPSHSLSAYLFRHVFFVFFPPIKAATCFRLWQRQLVGKKRKKKLVFRERTHNASCGLREHFSPKKINIPLLEKKIFRPLGSNHFKVIGGKWPYWCWLNPAVPNRYNKTVLDMN